MAHPCRGQIASACMHTHTWCFLRLTPQHFTFAKYNCVQGTFKDPEVEEQGMFQNEAIA